MFVLALQILFFTAGCPRSQITGKNLKKAVDQMGLDATIEMIDDPKLHKEHGVSAFPGIKIDGQILNEGDFRSVEECKEILSEFLNS